MTGGLGTGRRGNTGAVFDEPFLWRAEAASALGLDGAAIQLKLDNLDGARKGSDS